MEAELSCIERGEEGKRFKILQRKVLKVLKKIRTRKSAWLDQIAAEFFEGFKKIEDKSYEGQHLSGTGATLSETE